MLVLPSSSSLILRDTPSTSPDCQSPAVYRSPPYGEWYDPSNWTPRGPSPVPHTNQVECTHQEGVSCPEDGFPLLQVPCRHDTAVFPAERSYKTAVSQEDVEVAVVNIDGRNMDSADVRAVATSYPGNKMFKTDKKITVTGQHCGVRPFIYWDILSY